MLGGVLVHCCIGRFGVSSSLKDRSSKPLQKLTALSHNVNINVNLTNDPWSEDFNSNGPGNCLRPDIIYISPWVCRMQRVSVGTLVKTLIALPGRHGFESLPISRVLGDTFF